MRIAGYRAPAPWRKFIDEVGSRGFFTAKLSRSCDVQSEMLLAGPRFVRFFGPVLTALNELGGSGRPVEVYDRIAANLSMPERELNELLETGVSRFKNQVGWARFYLAKGGFIDASKRGVWTLTDKGRVTPTLTHPEALSLFKSVHEQFPRPVGPTPNPRPDDRNSDDPDGDDIENAPYREQLSEKLRSLSPEAFERFCKRLLREAGFEQVTVTGRAGDGGLDGIGILQVNPLVSFKVLFQCKRYSGSVVPSHVRDFRGAMQGRADKGIIITTGVFTTDAKKEGVRDGVPPIELVDGDKLLDMCEEYELGLSPVQTFAFDEAFFAEFE